MKGKKVFTKEEKAKIEKLLIEKCATGRNKQKAIRGQLRNMGFYISDFYPEKDGYDVEHFNRDIANGNIIIK